ncbi:hypothetical protein DP107_07215 [Haloglomus irregulare]|uniref:DUF5658 domain-containing protein n=1 Tax=Haloglomus irregulare TaxID=2234134 RepID=A0A554NBJ5_9EURY|nr:hypothetical protein [Haloglomus irregulare]TSD14752.1 hypothetical protein DP107_07215 [Haloglomus irregulare]
MGEEGPVGWLSERVGLLWVAAVLLYGVGDTVATLVGLSTASVAEGGPVAGPALEAYGPAGLIGLKTVVIGGFFIVWRLAPTPGRVALPLALVVTGGTVTGWNLFVIGTS